MPTPTPILATKLYTPPARPRVVLRPQLVERLDEGLALGRKLSLISASAGFGKTTLVSEWAAHCARPVAWLSLDEGDSDPTRFLTYLIAALQTLENGPELGAGMLRALQSPQPPPVESILATLVNEIAALPAAFALVLDDYHALDAKAVDEALIFLLDHLPPQMHLVIATREDPNLPLSRLRARNQLTELRAADLRFSADEAAGFLNQVMGLNLSSQNVAALETRTEGWIAGLQLAAISMQGHPDAASFIESFTGSHRFVLDYLIEEVLHQQPEDIQNFLLRTSILERMCGPLCNAVLGSQAATGQATLEYAENANLFIIPLDSERRWYRYHHLFGDLLRQRLRQSGDISDYHIRASQWYEDNGLELEAFQHAAAANDIPRAERLADGKGIPLHFLGATMTILNWLAGLPVPVKNARPSLWWKQASLMLVAGQTTGVDEKLDAAEAALQTTENPPDDRTRNLLGQICTARATLALTRYQAENIFVQAGRALEYLSPENLPFHSTVYWAMAFAHYLQGNRVAAGEAYQKAAGFAQASGEVFRMILATIGLANVQQLENQLHQAAETYRLVLQWASDQPLQIIYDVHLGLAGILYEWNDLDGAEEHGQKSLKLAQQYDSVIDRFIVCEVFLARLKMAQGDVNSAAAILARAEQSARQRNFVYRLPEIAAEQVTVLLKQGNITAAADLARAHELPLSLARVHLAQGNPSAALTVLETFNQQMQAKGWQDELLRGRILQAIAHQQNGEKDKSFFILNDVLQQTEPEGFIRVFVDEGKPMEELLKRMKDEFGRMKEYIQKILASFNQPSTFNFQPALDSLSPRELEILQLISQGLSNNEISTRLFLALSTVKGHNQKIFEKLQVQSRTEALARARELGLLQTPR